MCAWPEGHWRPGPAPVAACDSAGMDRNDLIAWAVASGVWIAVLGLLLWLASGERRRAGPVLAWAGPRLAAGLALWVAVFGAARWAEGKLGGRAESGARAVRSSGAHSGSRAR